MGFQLPISTGVFCRISEPSTAMKFDLQPLEVSPHFFSAKKGSSILLGVGSACHFLGTLDVDVCPKSAHWDFYVYVCLVKY